MDLEHEMRAIDSNAEISALESDPLTGKHVLVWKADEDPKLSMETATTELLTQELTRVKTNAVQFVCS